MLRKPTFDYIADTSTSVFGDSSVNEQHSMRTNRSSISASSRGRKSFFGRTNENDNLSRSSRSTSSVSIMRYLGLDKVPSRMGPWTKFEKDNRAILSTIVRSDSWVQLHSMEENERHQSTTNFLSQSRWVQYLNNRKFIYTVICAFVFFLTFRSRFRSQSTYIDDYYLNSELINPAMGKQNLRGTGSPLHSAVGNESDDIQSDIFAPSPIVQFNTKRENDQQIGSDPVPNNLLLEFDNGPSYQKPKQKIDPTDIINQFQDESHINAITESSNMKQRDGDVLSTLYTASNDSQQSIQTSNENKLDPSDVMNQFQFGNNDENYLHKPNKKYDPANIVNQFQTQYQTESDLEENTVSLAEAVETELQSMVTMEDEGSDSLTVNTNDILNQFQFGNDGETPTDQFKQGFDDQRVQNDENFNQETFSVNPNDIINQFQFGNNGEIAIQKPEKMFNPSDVINQFQGDFHDDAEIAVNINKSMSLVDAVESEIDGNPEGQVDSVMKDSSFTILAPAVQTELNEDLEQERLDPNSIMNQFQFDSDGEDTITKPNKKIDPSDVINQFRADSVSVGNEFNKYDDGEMSPISLSDAVQAELEEYSSIDEENA